MAIYSTHSLSILKGDDFVKNPIKKINTYFNRYGFLNLYGGASFYDKEAAINEYLTLYPDDNEDYQTYDQLYEVALSNVGKISFKEKTKDMDDYFYLLSSQDKIVAIAIGTLAYFIAKETDSRGLEIEKSIDHAIAKITGNISYDANNPFDTKSGMGHRMFGHDPAAFAFNNIPSDYLIYVKNEAVPNTRKIVRVAEYIDLPNETEYVSMWDIIWKFYGNESSIYKNIWNCVSHTVVHFAKDLFTPDGLPIPFTSLLENYRHEQLGSISASVLSYRESFYQKSKNAHIKASDFTSLAAIEAFIMAYCNSSHLSKDKISSYKDDMKIIAAGICIALQFSSLSLEQDKHIGKKGPVQTIDGAKINLPLFMCYMNTLRKEVASIYRANKNLVSFYKGDQL